jgi:hypothetical protein
MMRPSLRPLTALKLGASASVIVFAVWALAAGPGVDASRGTAPASGASTAGGRAAIAGAAVRRWQLTLAPAPDDLALAQVSFAHANGVGLSPRSLRVAVTGPFGDDYMVAGASHPSTGVRRALVLLVNRPSPLLDPSSVTLSLSALRSLGEPALRRVADAFAQKAAPTPALCDLPLHGAPLSGSELSVLGSRGAALAGFSAASALAQAYDVACGLAYSSAFARAVEPEASPAPPVGKVPGEGCVPTPGRACPLALERVRPGVGATRVPARAH